MKRALRVKSVGTKVSAAELRVLESRCGGGADLVGVGPGCAARFVGRDGHDVGGADDPGRGSGDANDPFELHAEGGRRGDDPGGSKPETDPVEHCHCV